MNVGLIFSNLGKAARSAAGTGVLVAKKHAPEMMVAGGLIGFIATIIETVHATNNTNDILERKETRIERVEEHRQDIDRYSEADYQADLKAIRNQTRWALFKTWAPVGTTAVASAALILGGYSVINGRYVATAAAYKTLEAGYERYRQNVVDKFGKDVDWQMAHTLKAEELDEERRKQREIRENEKRNKKRIPKTQYAKGINNQIFDINSSDNWKRFWIPSQVIDHIRSVESKLQDKVNIDGFALLNDAYEMLGMKKTSQGALVGWINTPRNKHNEKGRWVSLGFANDETPEDEIRRILSTQQNEDIFVWITPNCDGVIYQLIDKPFSER